MPRAHWRRAAIVAGVGVLALAAAACDNPQTAWIPASDYANEGKDLFQYIIFAGIVVGVLVEGALIFAAIRFRRKPTDGVPPQIHGNTLVEVTWTTVPAIVLLTILVPTIQTIFRTQAPAPSDAFQVHVVGHQFWWEFQYPDSGVVTADELHLPVDQTVNLHAQLGGRDPQLLGTRPGRQARRLPVAHQLHLADAGHGRRVSGPVLPAVRLLARQHAR